MTREEFLKKNPIEAVCASRGIRLIGNGAERKALCPLHKDRTPSFGVNVDKGLWRCYAGCGAGSVIDLLCKLDGISVKELFKREGIGDDSFKSPKRSMFGDMFKKKISTPIKSHKVEHVEEEKEEKQEKEFHPNEELIEAIYPYCNSVGKELYQVVRYKPKTFRQRHRVDGKWIWNMQGVERVLFNLPELLKSPRVMCLEGEKDVNNVMKLGFMATTNVGGAGKWLDAYSDSLAGKDVIICGDNDKDREDGSNPGRDHVQKVFDSVAGKAKTVKIIKLPQTVKDISDYIATFKTSELAKRAIEELIDASHPFVQGQKLPLYSISEIRDRYEKHVKSLDTDSLDLGRLFPSFRRFGVRPLVPGELVLISGDTGALKTCLLSSILLCAIPMPTLLFEIELPLELMFERFLAQRYKLKCTEVEEEFKKGNGLDQESLNKGFPNLQICPESVMTLADIDAYIARSELKFGEPCKVFGLDYAQLVQGRGDRYERISDTAEGLKVICKSRRAIGFMLSQVGRPGEGESEIGLHSAKGSGSLENSSGLVLGIWRDDEDKSLLHLKINKNTKGESGGEILVNVDRERMILTERAKSFGAFEKKGNNPTNDE